MFVPIPAKYTEVLYNLVHNEQAKSDIEEAMSDYPLYQTDPNRVKEYGTAYQIPTREELNTKIINHYMFMEIGQETFGQWLFRLKVALNEIMPRYNQLFYSADQDFNPIYNVDYVKTITGDGTSNSLSTTNSSDFGKGILSNTPQTELNISNDNIDEVTYADEASWNKNNSNATGTSNTTDHNSNIETTKGNFGVTSAQDLITKYRETIINIEQMIIEDPKIKELFMLIF